MKNQNTARKTMSCACGAGEKTRRKPGRAANEKAEVLKTLAHPLRLTVFEALSEKEMTVGELVTLVGAKEANTSRHLARMRAAGLVETRKEGLNVYYSIKMPCLLNMLDCVEEAVLQRADESVALARSLKK